MHDAPSQGELTYYFTFGLDSPLSNRVVALRGTMEHTRATMNKTFGTNWAGQYNATRWEEVSHKAVQRGRPYVQLVLGIPGERFIASGAGGPRPRLVDEHGQDHGVIVEVSSVDCTDPSVRSFAVYTEAEK